MQKHGATWRVRYGIGELKVDGKVVPPEKNPSPVFIWGGTLDSPSSGGYSSQTCTTVGDKFTRSHSHTVDG